MPSPTPLSVSGERPRVKNRSCVNVQARQVGTRHPVTFQVLNALHQSKFSRQLKRFVQSEMDFDAL